MIIAMKIRRRCFGVTPFFPWSDFRAEVFAEIAMGFSFLFYMEYRILFGQSIGTIGMRLASI